MTPRLITDVGLPESATHPSRRDDGRAERLLGALIQTDDVNDAIRELSAATHTTAVVIRKGPNGTWDAYVATTTGNLDHAAHRGNGEDPVEAIFVAAALLAGASVEELTP